MKFVLFFLAFISLAILSLVGWVMNLIDVINLAFSSSPLTTLFIIKLVGVPIAFLGSILGWL